MIPIPLRAHKSRSLAVSVCSAQLAQEVQEVQSLLLALLSIVAPRRLRLKKSIRLLEGQGFLNDAVYVQLAMERLKLMLDQFQ
jgi:hypothetical protein